MRLASVVAALLALGGGRAAHAQVTNQLAPVQLQWNVLGEFGNGLGIGANANVYAPNLPVFGGISLAWHGGTASIHAAGQRNTAVTRFFLGRDTVEVRAGLDLARWFAIALDSHYDHGFTPNADGSTSYMSDRYRSSVPAYGRRGLYVGARYLHPHGERCPGDTTLPEDCADVSSMTYILGASFFYAARVQINTRENGVLNLKRHRLIELRALYTPSDGYAHATLGRQLGGEVRWTLGGMYGITVQVAAGWDGDMALLNLGIGAGGPVSFTGSVPASDAVMK